MINALKSIPFTYIKSNRESNNIISFKGELKEDSFEISNKELQEDIKRVQALDKKFAELIKDENKNGLEIRNTLIESFNILKKHEEFIFAENIGHLAIDNIIKHDLQNDKSNGPFVDNYIRVLKERIDSGNLEFDKLLPRKTAITSLEVYTQALQQFIPLDEKIKTLVSKMQLIDKADFKDWNNLKLLIKASLAIANNSLNIRS